MKIKKCVGKIKIFSDKTGIKCIGYIEKNIIIKCNRKCSYGIEK
jgi:hypothetical protein